MLRRVDAVMVFAIVIGSYRVNVGVESARSASHGGISLRLTGCDVTGLIDR